MAPPPSNDLPNYTVAICTYRRGPVCLETLGMLLPLCPPGGELLVLDQSPEILTIPDALTTTAPIPVHYHHLPPHGLVASRNEALGRARGEIILFLDDDVLPSPTLIQAHLAAYQDPRVGGVAGQVLSPGQFPNPRGHPEVTDALRSFLEVNLESSLPGEVATARGCNMSFRREALRRAGGFDPHLHPPFCFREDSDVSFGIRALGLRLVYVPTASLVHLSAPAGGTRDVSTPPQALRREWTIYLRLYQHARDDFYFTWKHLRGPARSAHLWQIARGNIGMSRYPWRVLGKTMAIMLALVRAWMLWRKRPRRT